MSFLDIAAKRYSVRNYSDQKVEKDKILQVLEAARIAPTAVNYQPVHFIVVTDKDVRKKANELYPRSWFAEAPAVIIACGDHRTSWKRRDGKDHCDIDVAITVDHLILAAADMGLGTCWVCNFDVHRCSEMFGLPDYMEPMVLIPMGYPIAADTQRRGRKGMEEIVSWEKF